MNLNILGNKFLQVFWQILDEPNENENDPNKAIYNIIAKFPKDKVEIPSPTKVSSPTTKGEVKDVKEETNGKIETEPKENAA